MQRAEQLKAYFAGILPEDHLINLAEHGVDISTTIESESNPAHKVYSNIKERHFTLLFPWFWTHQIVAQFCQAYHADLTSEDVRWYLTQLQAVMKMQRDVHWLERVNLFHAFGLSRLVADEAPMLEIIENQFGYRPHCEHRRIETLTDMSAYNVIAMLSFDDVEETTTLLRKLEEQPRILPVFAKYQIYYYGGSDSLIETLKSYQSDRKAVMIPQSAAALLWLPESGGSERVGKVQERVREELLPSLPISVVNSIERVVRLRPKTLL